jgi:ATP-dependent Clp protease ATP-binding subunit ClpA
MINTVRQDTATDLALDQLVTAAATVAQLEDTSDALLGYFVDRCRREGRSWSEISAALGVTKQAVHKRFAATMADEIIASIPQPTFERFTLRARAALAAGARAARAAGQAQTSSPYLLLGLFDQPEGVAAKALLEMGVTQATVEAAIRAGAQAGNAGQAGADAQAAGTAGQASASGGTETADGAGAADDREKRFTPDGRRALRDTLAAALELGHNYIGTEHMLLGLYGDPAAPAAVILAGAGATEQQARDIVTQILAGFRPPSSQ